MVAALVLLASASTAQRLRAEERQRSLEVTASTLAPELEGAMAVVDLRFEADPGLTLDLAHVTVSDGWQVVGTLAGRLQLRKEVDCSLPLVLPRTVTVALTGPPATSRRVRVGSDDPTNAQSLRVRYEQACGLAGAAAALVLVENSLVRRDGTTHVSVTLANSTTAAVSLLDVRFNGFTFAVTPRLPITVPGRGSGLVSATRIPTQRLDLVAQVTDCSEARSTLRLRPPDLVTLFVRGRGGEARTDIAVRGLIAYLQTDRDERCG